ncbi:MAG: phosphate propanoyltransferase, partial [Propionibacteriaceae bacterium]|nr:phosphate propanoyltransferase [Propionibacteriaceae bacterium]
QNIPASVWDDVNFRLQHPIVEVEASGRHLHLSRADADVLLGRGAKLTPVHQLTQPGQFTCAEKIRVVGPKGEFSALTIIGPERVQSQVELSATDALTLGVKPPVRLSGDLAGTPGVTLVGPAGRVDLREGVMIAKRHIHMHPSFGERHGIHDRQIVSVRLWGERGVTFNNVAVRQSPDFDTYMHIDYDEANACGFRKGMIGTIIV